MADYHLWLLAAMILLIVEMLTAGFFAGSVVSGSVVAALAAYFGGSPVLQLLGAACGTLVCLLTIRPVVLRSAGTRSLPTGADALPGRVGYVVVEIDGKAETGRVRVGAEDWRARTEDSEVLPVGTCVIIQTVEGVTLIVTPQVETVL